MKEQAFVDSITQLIGGPLELYRAHLADALRVIEEKKQCYGLAPQANAPELQALTELETAIQKHLTREAQPRIGGSIGF